MSESQIIERNEDMSPMGRLALILQEDGDVIVAVRADPEELYQTSVEFCQPFSGGGRSPATLKALKALAEAMKKDNADRPIFTDPRRQLPPFDPKRYRSVEEMRAEIDRLLAINAKLVTACKAMKSALARYGPAIDDLFGNDEDFGAAQESLDAAIAESIKTPVTPRVESAKEIDCLRTELAEIKDRDERVSDLERRVLALLDEWHGPLGPGTIVVRWSKGGAQGEPWDPSLEGRHVMIPAKDFYGKFDLHNWFASPVGWENITWWIPAEDLKPPEIPPTS